MLWALGVGAAVAAVGTLTAIFGARSDEEAKSEAARLAREVYGALRAGEVGRALDLARRARAADTDGTEARLAWLHATGMSLLEGDADAAGAVGYLYEARELDFRGAELGFATLVSAVSMKNDRLARRFVTQHEDQEVAADAFYDFAVGAALDLDCDPASAEVAFASSANKWKDALLPRLRRARALLFDERAEEARVALSDVPAGGQRDVLASVIERTRTHTVTRSQVDPLTIVDMPRSIRPFAHALMLGIDGGQVAFEAALGDVDTPLMALSCARLALGAGDRDAAKRAAETALELRPELSAAAALLVTVELLGGDLASATRAAEASGDAESLSLVRAITAYEDRRVDALADVAQDGRASGVPVWKLIAAALGLLGRGAPPPQKELAAAAAKRIPWADVLMVDEALSSSDVARANHLMESWTVATEPRERRRRRAAEERAPDAGPK